MRNGVSAVVAALLLITTAVGARAKDEPDDLATSSTCYYGVGPRATVAAASDSNQKVLLRTLVLVDRARPSIAPTIMRRVIEEFGRIGLVLDVTYQPITLHGTDSAQLMKETRAHLARARITGFELVHVLTGADLTIDGNQIAGQAYCLGGIRYAKYYWAMSISETTWPESWGVGYKTFFKGGAALVAAHEIGHVLGALHQHGNCAENAKSALRASEATICTVMDTTLYYSKLRFGRAERAVMRGFAIRYGSP
ncbi:MAG TPA: zinc-dependent metalloprotease family protein [Acidimicrobiales bacterium]|nr:zinc-dependent metalloprotease family protein [Acidimicrobiales bacterium]